MADCVRVAAEGGSWPAALAAGATVCGLALVRDRNLAWTAAAGLAVYGLAAVITARWSLPAQPVGAPAAGLAVLGAAAVRSLPGRAGRRDRVRRRRDPGGGPGR